MYDLHQNLVLDSVGPGSIHVSKDDKKRGRKKIEKENDNEKFEWWCNLWAINYYIYRFSLLYYIFILIRQKCESNMKKRVSPN